MNETLKTIANRYSCRSFTDEAVSKEDVEAIALAGVQAPSAMNVQPWKIVVLRDKELIREMDVAVMDALSKQEDTSAYDRMMSHGGRLFYNTSCIFIVAMKQGTALDCGIVTENMALAASSLGLGNVICGMMRMVFDTAKGETFRETLIPAGYEFGMSLLVGHPAEDGYKEPHEADEEKIVYI